MKRGGTLAPVPAPSSRLRLQPGDPLVIVGGLCAAGGAALWSLPLGLVVLGVELVVVGLWWRE